MKHNPGALILEDGHEFSGSLMGAPVSIESISKNKTLKDFGYGEVIFNTSMTGYQEILTDPSYFGQMICLTASHIGNTGINLLDWESKKIACSALIVHDLHSHPSHWCTKESLNDFLIAQETPAITGVDTRALTRHLRNGVTRGILLPLNQKDQAQKLLGELPSFESRDLIREVSTKKPFHWKNLSDSSPIYRVVVLDLGVKWNLLRSLNQVGCAVEVVPAMTSATEILSRNPDGVFLSNGPGDPSAAPYLVKTVQQLLGKVPIFGVCMGHQILGLAVGGKTYKLKFGHRGGNQPVLDQIQGKIEISSHNHGYSIDAASLPAWVEITHINLNDKTVEGINIPKANAFSVQYHPESCPGPHDSMALFQQFTQNIKKHVSKIS